MTVTQLATLFSEQPYGAYFHGKVVDMFYFHFERNLLIGCLFGAATILLFNAILT
jgi:signal peptidase II